MKKHLLVLLFCCLTTPVFAANVALNQPVSCTSSTTANPARLVTDNVRASFWQGVRTQDTCTIALPAPRTISQFIVQMPLTNVFTVSQQMEVWRSNDNVNWYLVRRGTVSFNYCDGSANWPGMCSWPVSFGQGYEQTGRYWKFISWDRRKNGQPQIGSILGEVILNTL